MSERAILVSGFTALPDGWPEKVETHRDVLLVSDGRHVIGSRPFRGGLCLVATLPGGTRCSLDFHALAVNDTGVVHQALFILDRDGLDIVESPDVPAPFDRFKVGGERLPELLTA